MSVTEVSAGPPPHNKLKELRLDISARQGTTNLELLEDYGDELLYTKKYLVLFFQVVLEKVLEDHQQKWGIDYIHYNSIYLKAKLLSDEVPWDKIKKPNVDPRLTCVSSVLDVGKTGTTVLRDDRGKTLEKGEN